MNKTIAITLTFGLGFGLSLTSACDGGGEPAQDPDLAGRYLSDCLSAPQADGSTSYFVLDFDIADDAWAVDYTVFGDGTCQSPLFTVRIDGPYEIGAPSEIVDGAYDATFAFADKTITPHAQPIVAMLEGMDQCGTEAWVLDQPQSIYATGCPALGQYPEASCAADHDLVKLDGDSLQFGARPANNDMCTAERRPTALNPVLFRRQ